MRWLPYLILPAAVGFVGLGIGIHAQAPADAAVHAVSYVDVLPSGRASMVAALEQYRDASRKDDGYVRFDLLEQVGWPGHFAVVETWRDQKAFDAHGTAAHTKQYRDALQPIRVSGYDQRPYKTLTVAPPAGTENADTVYIVAHVDIAGQGAQAEAPGLLRRLAEASRKEPGNLRFDVLQHMMRANHYTVVEAWQSQNAHAAHAAAVHTREYRDVVQPITGSPLDERLYKAVE
jgi:autoinducer 2-degrading protein